MLKYLQCRLPVQGSDFCYAFFKIIGLYNQCFAKPQERSASLKRNSERANVKVLQYLNNSFLSNLWFCCRGRQREWNSLLSHHYSVNLPNLIFGYSCSGKEKLWVSRLHLQGDFTWTESHKLNICATGPSSPAAAASQSCVPGASGTDATAGTSIPCKASPQFLSTSD